MRRLDDKSRMSGDVHVRICERLGVGFPRATRLVVNFQYRRDAEEFHKSLTDRFGRFGLEMAEERKDAGNALRTLCPGGPSEDRKKPDTFDFLAWIIR